MIENPASPLERQPAIAERLRQGQLARLEGLRAEQLAIAERLQASHFASLERLRERQLANAERLRQGQLAALERLRVRHLEVIERLETERLASLERLRVRQLEVMERLQASAFSLRRGLDTPGGVQALEGLLETAQRLAELAAAGSAGGQSGLAPSVSRRPRAPLAPDAWRRAAMIVLGFCVETIAQQLLLGEGLSGDAQVRIVLLVVVATSMLGTFAD